MKTLPVVLLCAVLVCVSEAQAQMQARMGLTAGTEYGLGAVARIGSNDMLVEAGGGLAPFWVFVTGVDELEIYFPFTVGAKLSIATTKGDNPNRFGVKFGISYNSILKTGFGGGVDYVVSKDPQIVLGGGLMYYPGAVEGVTDKYREDTGRTAVFGEEVGIQPAVSISVFFGK